MHCRVAYVECNTFERFSKQFRITGVFVYLTAKGSQLFWQIFVFFRCPILAYTKIMRLKGTTDKRVMICSDFFIEYIILFFCKSTFFFVICSKGKNS